MAVSAPNCRLPEGLQYNIITATQGKSILRVILTIISTLLSKTSVRSISVATQDIVCNRVPVILGDPGADKGSQGKSKRAGKYGTKKSNERREEPLGQCLTRGFLAPIRSQNGGDRLELTLSPGGLLAVLYFSSSHIFPPV